MGKLKLLELHLQFLTNEKGTKTAVQLPLKEFELLMRLFEDLEDIVDLEQARLKPDETVTAADFWPRQSLVDKYKVVIENKVYKN